MTIGLIGRVFANDPGDRGSIFGRVIPKTQKMVLDAALLHTQHYKVRIKGKVLGNPRNGVTSSPTPWCSSYWKGSLRVSLNYARQQHKLLQLFPGVSTWCNVYRTWLRNRSKRVRTIFHSLSGKYLWEGYEPSYPPGYGLISINAVLLKGWLWHKITHEGWYTIKQRNLNLQLSPLSFIFFLARLLCFWKKKEQN